MKIDKVRETANDATLKLSELSRQLSLVGIAVIWLFLIGKDTGDLRYSGEIAYPLASFVISLFLDLIQYVYTSIRWKCIGDRMDEDKVDEQDVDPRTNTPAYILFWTKILFVVTGYFFVGINFGDQILR